MLLIYFKKLLIFKILKLNVTVVAISKLRILFIDIYDIWDTNPPNIILKDVWLRILQLTFDIPTEEQEGVDEKAIDDGILNIAY